MNQSIDYDEIGLIVGLEVHQQLLTRHKMFCHCPARLSTNTHDGTALRHLRPTLSEVGGWDGTAAMEYKTRKNIVYLLHHDNVCTHELTDAPPVLVNRQAVDVAIEQCLMLGCDIVDEVHFARKQYLDGSMPGGFQRTALVGVGGRLPFRGRDLTITQVNVEEDSCREVSDRGHLVVWRTDRLGIPLVETVTGPDLRTPDEVEEAILLIGRVCRSTGHVRVGSGSCRQDINVSVNGGRRVEIKGVPQAGWAPTLVHGEAVRQLNLLRLRDELHRRGYRQPADIGVEHREVTELFTDSPLEFLRARAWQRFVDEDRRRPGLELGRGAFCVRAVRLRGLAGTLNQPTQPDHTFAHELAGRIRVVAALDQQPIMLHDGKWPDYHGASQELRRLRRLLRCGPDDAMVLVWGAFDDTVTAAEEVRLRFSDATQGVPHETRQPFEDGSTDFERILPGPDRMYPDADCPPLRVKRDRVKLLRLMLPEAPWVREERYRTAGVPPPTIHYLIRRNRARLVDRLVSKYGADTRRTCFLFGERLKGLRRLGVPVDDISAERWGELFRLLVERPVLWEAWKELVIETAARPDAPVAVIVAERTLDDNPEGWRAVVARTVAEARPDHPDGARDQLVRFLIGRTMGLLRGKVPVADVVAAIAEEIGVQT